MSIRWQEEAKSIYGSTGEGCLNGKEDILKAGNVTDLLLALINNAEECNYKNKPFAYPELLKLLLSGELGWSKYSAFVLSNYIKISRG